jgi:RNA polymerase sigma-70 factor, ECF subfamily
VSLPAANFHELYERYGHEVYRFALYLCGDATRAEDLSAEAFLRLWAATSPIRVATAKSYLLAVVRNLYAEQWRTRRREVPVAEMVEPAGKDPPADRRYEHSEELARVVQALQSLDPTERAALLLRGEHELPYEEIATLLDITVVAARVHVHRARRKLLEIRQGETSR